MTKQEEPINEPELAVKKLKRLTPKQQLFCESWAKCQNGTQAAKDAGYSGLSVPKMASDLLKLPHIQQAIATLLEKVLADTGSDVSPGWVISQLKEIITEARTAADRTNAIRAIELIGKTLRMFEKVEQNSGVTVVITSGIPHAPGLQAVIDVTPAPELVNFDTKVDT